MIISNLDYLESAENADVVGGGAVPATKNVDLKTSVNQKFGIDIDVDVDKDVKSIIKSATDVKGNAATTIFDNTALGTNTYVESNLANTVVQGKLSESSGSLFAAANK